MSIQGDELFKLTEDTVKRIRYIRLNKKASYLEKELDTVAYNKVTRDECDIIQFYTFGFYDSLTCIKQRNDTISLAHKEHFLISYPFKKTANTLRVEQWFGILPLFEKRNYMTEGIGESEPFYI